MSIPTLPWLAGPEPRQRQPEPEPMDLSDLLLAASEELHEASRLRRDDLATQRKLIREQIEQAEEYLRQAKEQL